MQPQLIPAASRLPRFPRRQLLWTSNRVGAKRHPVITVLPPHSIRENDMQAAPHIQSIAFSTANDRSSPLNPTKDSKKKLGFIARIGRVLRTLFGANDDTPRSIQERNDMYWIVLAVAHRKLRVENQRRIMQVGTAAQPWRFAWREEPKEKLKNMVDEAVSYLEGKTDINRLPLRRLRVEVQSFLEPQIVHLLSVACHVEEEMNLRHYVDGCNPDYYRFSEEEERKFKEVLSHDHKEVCQLVRDCAKAMNDGEKKHARSPDPMPYYLIKRGAIELLLAYFNWCPKRNTHSDFAGVGRTDYVDEFGFCPSKSDTNILPAMRCYQVRNLVRSSLVRGSRYRVGRSHKNDDSDNTQHARLYHSLLSFKSTIPSAGRGVFVDGFAPAGTLLGLIPGRVWLKEHLVFASLQTQVQFSENDPRHQLSMRWDDILIDSRQNPYTVVKNLWALGHIVNHPPAPTSVVVSSILQHKEESGTTGDNDANYERLFQGPNCVTVPINFTKRLLRGNEFDELCEYIPNEYELPPKPWVKGMLQKEGIIMYGMGLVALRDVKDEELFYDYRLSPDEDKKEAGENPYPSWYYVWDKQAMNNRWNVNGY